MERLVDETGADELIVVTDTFDPDDRLRSYQRLAGIAGRIELKSSVRVGA